jgi:hypothetical protein
MIPSINDDKIQKILWAPGKRSEEWKSDLERFEKGDVTLTRKSAGESSIKAVQRLLFFLGYSTSSTGAFAIDGDFGRGTNRAVAQFRFEHGMTRQDFRKTLCYACNWQNARSTITTIPDVRLTVNTLEKMLDSTIQAIENNEVMCGSFKEAVYHLNNVHKRALLNCRQIFERYGTLVDRAVTGLANQRNINIRPEWILSIMRQETGGVVRPRFEQHLLTRYDRKEPGTDFVELRYRSMSFGLGQILGVNYKRVGAASARAMFVSPLDEQVLFIARFLAHKPSVASVVSRKNPSEQDFHTVAKYYNGPGYAKHHYHERIARWFREFRDIL